MSQTHLENIWESVLCTIRWGGGVVVEINSPCVFLSVPAVKICKYKSLIHWHSLWFYIVLSPLTSTGQQNEKCSSAQGYLYSCVYSPGRCKKGEIPKYWMLKFLTSCSQILVRMKFSPVASSSVWWSLLLWEGLQKPQHKWESDPEIFDRIWTGTKAEGRRGSIIKREQFPSNLSSHLQEALPAALGWGDAHEIWDLPPRAAGQRGSSPPRAG